MTGCDGWTALTIDSAGVDGEDYTHPERQSALESAQMPGTAADFSPGIPQVSSVRYSPLSRESNQ